MSIDQGEVVQAVPVSWVLRCDLDSENEDDNANLASGDSDTPITNFPMNEVESQSTLRKRKGRRPEELPKEMMENWKVEKIPRTDGSGRIDKKYHHKTRPVTLRSLKTAKKYDEDGTLPKRKSKSKTKENEIIHAEKEEILGKEKDEAENMHINVEEFLAEAYYNLLHDK
ncbi:hypothetical protein QL285_012695 [Trifolium repens]|nr:hypothetical protein QL285_012695 [Trifolium repens]